MHPMNYFLLDFCLLFAYDAALLYTMPVSLCIAPGGHSEAASASPDTEADVYLEIPLSPPKVGFVIFGLSICSINGNFEFQITQLPNSTVTK
jgi:hypothetical protein